jgi:hypothetical protein
VKLFPNIKCIFKNITHLGEGNSLEREKVKNLSNMSLLTVSSNNSIINYKNGMINTSNKKRSSSNFQDKIDGSCIIIYLNSFALLCSYSSGLKHVQFWN